MKPSQNCIEIVKHFEGCYLKSYKCPAGVWTIGIGSTHWPDGRAVVEGEVCTQDQAESMLLDELTKCAKHLELNKLLLTQSQTDALCSFIYNVGIGAFIKSTLLRIILTNPSDPNISQQFYRWNRVGGNVLEGLTRRRLSEAHLYFTGQLKFNWKF